MWCEPRVRRKRVGLPRVLRQQERATALRAARGRVGGWPRQAGRERTRSMTRSLSPPGSNVTTSRALQSKKAFCDCTILRRRPHVTHARSQRRVQESLQLSPCQSHRRTATSCKRDENEQSTRNELVACRYPCSRDSSTSSDWNGTLAVLVVVIPGAISSEWFRRVVLKSRLRLRYYE